MSSVLNEKKPETKIRHGSKQGNTSLEIATASKCSLPRDDTLCGVIASQCSEQRRGNLNMGVTLKPLFLNHVKNSPFSDNVEDVMKTTIKGIDNSIIKFHTISMKIAISIPDDLFEKVERFARQNKYSRSKVFIMAVRAFLEKVENRKLLDDLNAAYSIEETDEEKKVRELGKRHFAEIVSRENK